MTEPKHSFQVGDQVVHWTHGPGMILQMDEKELSGRTCLYYVVQINDLTLWVPASENGERCLRHPTHPAQFEILFSILSSPGEPLPPDRYERKTFISERMKSGSLDAICSVIRDLTEYSRIKKLNEYDTAALERARSFLLSEWSLAFAIPVQKAQHELDALLGHTPSRV